MLRTPFTEVRSIGGLSQGSRHIVFSFILSRSPMTTSKFLPARISHCKQIQVLTMKITLYVDVVSPFAYIAYHILRVCSGFHYAPVGSEALFLTDLRHSMTPYSRAVK